MNGREQVMIGDWRGPVLLVVGVVIVWQLLYMVVGDIALRSPLESAVDREPVRA